MSATVGVFVVALIMFFVGLVCIRRFFSVYKKAEKELRWRDFGMALVLAGTILLIFSVAMFLKYHCN